MADTGNSTADIQIHEMFFSLEHLASLIFFFQQKNLEVNMLFFHGCFCVYRIEVGNETLTFSFYVFMDLDIVSVHKNAKRELGQYPAILTSCLVCNNIYLIL